MDTPHPGAIVCWRYADDVQIGLVEARYADGNFRVRPLERPHRALAKPLGDLLLLWTLEQLRAAAKAAR